MSINPLNDISRVYLEQVAAVEEGMTMKDFKQQRSRQKQKEKRAADKIAPNRRKDIHTDRLSPERAARHRANVDPDFEGNDEREYPGGKLKNPKKIRKAKALGEIGESAVPGKPAERLGAVTAIPKSERDAARERALAKAKAMREKKKIKEALDPVGKEDTDVDNDGKKNTKSDKYLLKRRAAISKAMTHKEALDPVGREDRDIDNDGDHDKSDKYLLNRRRVRNAAIVKKRVAKESYSNWREELSEIVEVVSKDKNDQKIVEKNIKNNIKTSAIGQGIKLGEAVESLGGTLIEMVEIDEVDYIVESVYDELLEEGYEEDDIEEAIEYALIEAKVTYGHDTPTTEKKKEGLLSAVRKRLSGIKKAAKQAVATGARKVAKGALGVARRMEKGDGKPSSVHSKSGTRAASTYRGSGSGQKEKVSSGSYTGPTKKKAEPVADPWEGSATTPPKPKAKKATAKPKATAKTTKASAKPKETTKTTKKKRVNKLDDLIASVRSEQVSIEPKLKPGSGLGGGVPVYPKDKQPKPTGAKLPLQKAHYEPSGNLIDEKTLTAAETQEKERIVKSMKPKAAEFERRYPGRGEEVMYATATKMAKKTAKKKA